MSIENTKSMNDQERQSVMSTTNPWVVWGVAALFYLYEVVLRVSPSVMTTQLMTDFHVTSTALGVLTSCYYYAYVALQIPCGLIVDKLGSRLIITLSCALSAIGILIFSHSTELIMAQFGRFLIGAGAASAFISCLKVTSEWFSPAKFALVAGLSNMMGTLGGTLASSPLARMVNTIGWRKTTELLAVFGMIITVIAWVFLRDKHVQMNKEHPVSVLDSLKTLSKNKQIWLAGIIGGFMYLPISAFSELWAVPFLMHTYNISSELASSANIMVFIGMAVGSPIAASLADRLQSYVRVMSFSAVITSALFFFIALAEYVPFYAIYIALFFAGMTIGGQVLCFTCSKNNSSLEISGTTAAFTNALVMMSGIIFQPLLGAILDFFWDGQLSEAGIRIYNQDCYQYSIMALPIALFASWFLLRYVKETYVKTTDK